MSEETTLVAEHMRAELAGEPGPVTGPERISSIDMLRGIAVAGILVMNIYWFAMPSVAYSNPLAYGGTQWYNLGTWFFTHIFFDQKFLPIFSMLFGAGLVMMADRAEAHGTNFHRIWFRRTFWLLIIGAIHAYLVWDGDILFPYAVVGMLIYFLRNQKPSTLIIVACLVLPISPFFSYKGALSMQELQSSAQEIQELQASGEELSEDQLSILEKRDAATMFLAPPEEQVRKQLEANQKGYVDILKVRVPFVLLLHTQGLVFFSIWRLGGLMLLGMALFKLGVLSGERQNAFYRKLMLTGYSLGLPIVLFGAYDLSMHQWNSIYMFKIGGIANYFGGILVSLGHIGCLMLLIKSGALRNLLGRFAAMGRMALTNYLLQSVILTTVFYGYGLGLYGAIPRIWQMLFVVAVVGLQLWFSPLWLRKYRFGPVEWLWRSLTYWKRQPMRRAVAA